MLVPWRVVGDLDDSQRRSLPKNPAKIVARSVAGRRAYTCRFFLWSSVNFKMIYTVI